MEKKKDQNYHNTFKVNAFTQKLCFQNTILAQNVILLKSFPSVHYVPLSPITLAES